MKFLKVLIALLLLILTIFLAMGLLRPTINYGHEIVVDKPLAEAWSVQQDESKFNQWLKGFKSIEHLSGEPGAVGSKYKIVVSPGDGQPDFIMTETVKSIQENDHISLNMDSEMMVFDQKTSFEDLGGKTKIKTESSVKGKGIMMRSMFAMMDLLSSSFEKQEIENIENLKEVINSNTTQY